jgi:hypothetical protein
MKAHGIDIANQTTAELALLIGAAGFQADTQIAKTRRDIQGFQLADGLHESLLVTAGRRHVPFTGSDGPAPRTGSGSGTTALVLQRRS